MYLTLHPENVFVTRFLHKQRMLSWNKKGTVHKHVQALGWYAIKQVVPVDYPIAPSVWGMFAKPEVNHYLKLVTSPIPVTLDQKDRMEICKLAH